MIDDMQVYIANLGKYNEGELVGDWFSFPLDEEVIAERIGLNAEYEEYAIHDTDNFRSKKTLLQKCCIFQCLRWGEISPPTY